MTCTKWFCIFFIFLQGNIYPQKNVGMYEFIMNKDKTKKTNSYPPGKQAESKNQKIDNPEQPIIQELPEIKDEKEKKEEVVVEEESKPYQPTKKYVLKRKGLGGSEEVDEAPALSSLEDNQGKRYALVIGVNDYNDPEIPDLSKARNDAKAIAKILKERGQFNEVDVMTDDIDSKNNLYPTKLNIMEKLDSILNYSTKDDLIVFFFSGHGIADNNEKAYLVTVDTVADKQYSTSLKVDHIVEKLKEFKIKKSLLILDACREVVKKTKSTSQNRLKNQEFSDAELTAVFYSTAKGQFSYEDDQTDYGVFTKFMVYGMEGKADYNGDSVITFGELASFVETGVNKWSRDRNKKQRPFTKIYGEKSGDLALTLKSDSDISLVDKPIPKIFSKYEIAGLSALVPGLGHYKNDRTVLGYSLSIPYFIAWILGTGYFYANYQKMESLKAAYNNSPMIPYSKNLGETSTFNYIMDQSRKSEFEAQYAKTNMALGVLLGFWAWNVFDAFYFYKTNDVFSINFEYKTQTINSMALESRGNIQIDFRF